MNIRNTSVGLVLLTAVSAVVLLTAVSAAFAGIPSPVESTFAPTTTGDHVALGDQQIAEQGFISISDDYPVNVVAKSTLTRQQVQSELRAANHQPFSKPSYAELVFLR
ncbi:DUF4148 domain-containing protein [Glaciimonas immobilis]|uniref:Cytochrome c oxidase assembly factor CtaG n=1 Tax=Glaciimonas immobilis TaxID=728004 RepID=A0A840RUV7_9BURK|nr:DUF4148 domain-containing protein [Glaciimonas immobilis]KAF3997631.1 DUF4148 domain-containing protein [Glaciimonas immobilis]MBB5200666.1 cytochrome c oxidase assembly factor CtaG [Glaciimonas immobilis]